MSDNDNEILQDETDFDEQDDELDYEQDEELDEEPSRKSAKRSGKVSKKSARASARETARLKKEWEDSIVASKRVKREELRAKLKRAMLIMLVFALIVTSVVYVMLLFIEENNIRITVTNRNKEKSITLSMDNEFWTPYLNADGPDDIDNITYNTNYSGIEHPDNVSDVPGLLNVEDFKIGSDNGEHFIRFTFMLRNNGSSDAHVDYEMTLDFDNYNLHEAVRVMWGENYKNQYGEVYDSADSEKRTQTAIYAALSHSDRLAGTSINEGRTVEDGFIEYVAYNQKIDSSVTEGSAYYYVSAYENELAEADDETRIDATHNGFWATTPFDSDEYVFRRSADLSKGDIMYCYLCIWLEGTDFECIDDVVGGFCKMGINFYAS